MAGKKVQNKSNTTSVEVAQTTPVAATPVVDTSVSATPVVETKQKGGRKAKTVEAAPVVAAPVVAAPVVAAPVVAAPVVAETKKGKGKTVAPAVVATVAPVAAVVAETPVQKGKKQKAVKAEASPAAVVTVTVTDAENQVPAELSERHVRSFKVKLPNKEEFEGRFTGLTPYQAANKALSKYFRETETPSAEITFSICESTRKSKKSVYTYVGKRQKLDVPVTYKIQDGREIVKNFKNSLKKVKKSDSVQATENVATA
jgi:hypothetical protein